MNSTSFCAIARGGFVIVRVERAGRQAFERRLRMRTHRQQPLGILLDGSVILARHADGDQIHQAFFRLRILFQNLADTALVASSNFHSNCSETALPNSAVS